MRSSSGAGILAKAMLDTSGAPFCCGKFRALESRLLDLFFLNHFMMLEEGMSQKLPSTSYGGLGGFVSLWFAKCDDLRAHN
jgi:hypothetical protein